MSASTTTSTEGTTTAIATLLGGETAANTIHTGGLPSSADTGGNEPPRVTDNPSWWPTDHRRIPDYRPIRYHPEWTQLADSVRQNFMITVMFGGCHVLAVSWRCMQMTRSLY